VSQRDPTEFFWVWLWSFIIGFAAIASFSPGLAMLFFLGGMFWGCYVAFIEPLKTSRKINKQIKKMNQELARAPKVRRSPSNAERAIDEAEALRKFRIIENWHREFEEACSKRLKLHGWLSRSFVKEASSTKPHLDFSEKEESVLAGRYLAPTRIVYETWKAPVKEICDEKNQRHVEAELSSKKEFFQSIEAQPLTKEQSIAVLCFDDRVKVMASAGSGKTSALIAKVVYATKQQYFGRNEVLVLAFNRDAADELNERIQDGFRRQGLDAEEIFAQTFHAFGLGVIGQATGKKPSLAHWVDSGCELEELQYIVKQLQSEHQEFAERWDMFRLVFAQDLSDPDEDEEPYDTWDSENCVFWRT